MEATQPLGEEAGFWVSLTGCSVALKSSTPNAKHTTGNTDYRGRFTERPRASSVFRGAHTDGEAVKKSEEAILCRSLGRRWVGPQVEIIWILALGKL